MIINGTEVNFDLSNPEHAKHYEDALAEFLQTISVVPENAALHERLSVYVPAVRDFFYNATGEDALTGVTSLREALVIWDDFNKQIDEQNEELANMVEAFQMRTPEAQRRAEVIKENTAQNNATQKPVPFPAQYMGRRPSK